MAHYEATLQGYFNLSKYKHPNEVKQDIISTLIQYRDLRPSLSPFVFNDGTQRQLVQLEGTIPVNFKGNIYNIPISLWVLDTHPYNPPMVFVKPTDTMQIKPGRYVDANGKVDMPFIREWRHPTSDLLSLVQILNFTFREECPVFSIAPQPMPYPGQPPNPMNPGDSMDDEGSQRLEDVEIKMLQRELQEQQKLMEMLHKQIEMQQKQIEMQQKQMEMQQKQMEMLQRELQEKDKIIAQHPRDQRE